MTDLASAQAALDAYSQALQTLVGAVGPAVVRVQATGQQGHRGGRHGGHWRHGRARSDHGSGVVIDAEAGHIATSFHVVRNAEEVLVHRTDGTPLRGEVIGADADIDLAVIKVEPDGLSAAAWGDSDALRLGSLVLALGNPDGDTVVVTSGIVSALNRALRGPAGRLMEGLIQTDTIFNPGMSGGPLVNSAGHVVGINTASLVEAQGINLAISSKTARKLAQDLILHGRVQRPRLGIAGERQRLYDGLVKHHSLEQTHGVFLHEVVDSSPAAAAGVRKGDILIGADGDVVEGLDDLHRILTGKQYGETMTLRLLRDLDLIETTVTLTPPESGTV
jgi:S1-C subfamily serine protease